MYLYLLISFARKGKRESFSRSIYFKYKATLPKLILLYMVKGAARIILCCKSSLAIASARILFAYKLA
jgi:hypothetical protein